MLAIPQNLQMDFVPAGRCCHHRYRSLVGGIISGVCPKIQKFTSENTEYTWDALSTLQISRIDIPLRITPAVKSAVMTDKKHGDLW